MTKFEKGANLEAACCSYNTHLPHYEKFTAVVLRGRAIMLGIVRPYCVSSAD